MGENVAAAATIEYVGTCMFCRAKTTVHVPIQEMQAFQRGELRVQHALVSLSAEEREVVLNGTCFDCP